MSRTQRKWPNIIKEFFTFTGKMIPCIHILLLPNLWHIGKKYSRNRTGQQWTMVYSLSLCACKICNWMNTVFVFHFTPAWMRTYNINWSTALDVQLPTSEILFPIILQSKWRTADNMVCVSSSATYLSACLYVQRNFRFQNTSQVERTPYTCFGYTCTIIGNASYSFPWRSFSTRQIHSSLISSTVVRLMLLDFFQRMCACAFMPVNIKPSRPTSFPRHRSKYECMQMICTICNHGCPMISYIQLSSHVRHQSWQR